MDYRKCASAEDGNQEGIFKFQNLSLNEGHMALESYKGYIIILWYLKVIRQLNKHFKNALKLNLRLV